VNDDYLDLVKRFPLRPLRTEAELEEATLLFSRLAGRVEPLSEGERDYMEAIEQFIDTYESKQKKSAFLTDNPFKTPTDFLRHVVKQAGMSVNDLARVLGLTHAAASMILSGKRAISRANAVKLSHHFHVDVSGFIA
jgi:HTH-type transcriptional regulator/antitoxin HigA